MQPGSWFQPSNFIKTLLKSKLFERFFNSLKVRFWKMLSDLAFRTEFRDATMGRGEGEWRLETIIMHKWKYKLFIGKWKKKKVFHYKSIQKLCLQVYILLCLKMTQEMCQKVPRCLAGVNFPSSTSRNFLTVFLTHS